jgi:hypothetical protein
MGQTRAGCENRAGRRKTPFSRACRVRTCGAICEPLAGPCSNRPPEAPITGVPCPAPPTPISPASCSTTCSAIKAKAAEYGLDFFEVVFEVLPFETMNQIAAYGGFPTRYPHWKLGHGVREALSKRDAYGLGRIYEMVINNDPCYAYLQESNSRHRSEARDGPRLRPRRLLQEQLLVQQDQPQDDGRDGQPRDARAPPRRAPGPGDRRAIPRPVPHDRAPDRPALDVRAARGVRAARRASPRPSSPTSLPAKDYMDPFINPERGDAAPAPRRTKRSRRPPRAAFPKEPTRDVLLFLLRYAPLEEWQQDILSIIRDEAYYYAPAGHDQDHERGVGHLLALQAHDPALPRGQRDRPLRRPALGRCPHAAGRVQPLQDRRRAVQGDRTPLEHGAARPGVGATRLHRRQGGASTTSR